MLLNKLKDQIMRAIALLLACLLVGFNAATADDTRHIEYPTYFTHANGLSIAYQDFGQADKGTILLVMGLGAQMIAWNDEIVTSLVDAGYRVIRFDNRDVGWSEKLYDESTPGILTGIRFKLGMSLGSPYKLDDMAADAIGLLDALNIAKVHVVGASMGGMIVQIMTARYPERVQSLTSIMSSSGAAHLPQGTVNLNMSAENKTREEAINATVDLVQQFGGSVGQMDRDVLYKRLARYYDRSHYAPGGARQFWAILDSGDRVELLKSIKQPTVGLHGVEDTLVPYSHGEHTAEMVSGSKLVALEGMGHSIDDASLPIIVSEILAVAAQAE